MTIKKKYKYIFGPVPSRRLGRSLGIDLLPFKTCSLDCVFCQLGRTPEQAFIREVYAPIDDVLFELDHWLKTDGEADCLTLAGSGEPTLHSDFGSVLEFIQKTPIPSVLLTNSTQLYLPEVRKAASLADTVKVSLSAWDQHSFETINRPHPQYAFDMIFQGLKDFRNEFKGKLWMEVFLVPGLNTELDNVKKIAVCAKEIKPDRIQLNTAVRPPAESFVAPLQQKDVEALVHFFEPVAEIIANFSLKQTKEESVSKDKIVDILRRRPCTAEQIAQAYGLHVNEVIKQIEVLLQKKRIQIHRKNNEIYYTSIECK